MPFVAKNAGRWPRAVVALALATCAAAVFGGMPSPGGASVGSRVCLAAGAGPQESGDIMGPLEPLGFPSSDTTSEGRWPRRLAAGALALGFAALALYLLYRRRRCGSSTGGSAGLASAALPMAELDGLSDAEFYARLLGMVRARLKARGTTAADALTPRELARLELGPALGVDSLAASGLSEQWKELCERGERAEYGGARVEPGQRRADLEFVMALMKEARAAGP